MKKDCNGKRCFIIGIPIVLFLIISGSIMTGHVFKKQNEVISENQDAQLLYAAETIDRNIARVIMDTRADMDYVINRRGFVEAEGIWRMTGNYDDLMGRMSDNRLTQERLISNIIAVNRDGEVMFSTDGSLEYYFPKVDRETDLRPCIRDDGRVFLVLFGESEHGDIFYGALIDMCLFYTEILGEALINIIMSC
ncbi:MAG: hypothetical protein Q4B67_05595 [Eubacteriales bacterium]|nr:hypothetical protein [Eubacteriales bacterium]